VKAQEQSTRNVKIVMFTCGQRGRFDTRLEQVGVQQILRPPDRACVEDEVRSADESS
jgi:hypothetical protein